MKVLNGPRNRIDFAETPGLSDDGQPRLETIDEMADRHSRHYLAAQGNPAGFQAAAYC